MPDLARKSYFRQSSVSKIESGRRSVSSEEILYFSYVLDKPILYFFPEEFQEQINLDDLTILEQDLLNQARRLHLDDLRKLIAQARAIADFQSGNVSSATKDSIEKSKSDIISSYYSWERVMWQIQTDHKRVEIKILRKEFEDGDYKTLYEKGPFLADKILNLTALAIDRIK